MLCINVHNAFLTTSDFDLHFPLCLILPPSLCNSGTYNSDKWGSGVCHSEFERKIFE